MGYLQQNKPEMQSHFPPGKNTVLYSCHYSSDAQATFYLHSGILLGLFGEMKAREQHTDKGDWLCMSIHIRPIMGKSIF